MRFLLVVALVLLGASSGRAEPGPRWAVVRLESGAKDTALRAVATDVEARLAARSVDVAIATAVDGELGALGLSTVPPVSAEHRAALRDAERLALEDVAYGRDDAALARGHEMLARSRPYLASLGRSESLSLENLCLYLVRARLHSHQAKEAHSQARECLVMAPGLAPNPELHPPQVLDTVEAVRDEARHTAQAEVVVSTLAASPGSVALFLQGQRIAVGSAGRFALRLIPGEYQLRVGMDGVEGPVWHLKLNAGDRRVINVDRLRTRLFDRGHPLFWRAARDAGASSDQPPGSVAALAALLELDAVVIASRRDPQTLLLERYTLVGQSWTVSAHAEIHVELKPNDDENVAPAVESLLR